MKIIIAKSKRYGSQKVMIDDEDFEELSKYKWTYRKTRKHGYVLRNSGTKNKGTFKVTRIHRLLMKVTDKNIVVDHIDHNTLNNQKQNLRICTTTQNAKNRTSYGISKYLGVHVSKQKIKENCKKIWQASIRGRYLGMFLTEEDAAKAYDEAAKIEHGEFANLNFKTT